MGTGTASDPVDSLSPPAGPGRPARGRRPVVVGVAIVVAALVLAGLGWAWHWSTHPDVFPQAGNSMGMKLQGHPREVYAGITFPQDNRHDSISIQSATPRIVKNTAGATFEFYVCSVRSGRGGIGTSRAGGVAHMCPRLVPVRKGTKLALGFTTPQQLLMKVAVHRAGVLRTKGVDLTYAHGRQRGSQTIGSYLRIKAR